MEKPNTVTIHNKISPNYKQIHADGVFAGVTPTGHINLNFYAEREPIPKATEFHVTTDGFVGNPIGNSSDSKIGILREFEMGIYMNVDVARSMVQLLMAKISQFDELNKR